MSNRNKQSESQALHQLTEVADLIGMIEDLFNPGNVEILTASSIAGMRITLRNARQQTLASHKVLASGMVDRTMEAEAPRANNGKEGAAIRRQTLERVQQSQKKEGQEDDTAGDVAFSRSDLKSSLEKYIEER